MGFARVAGGGRATVPFKTPANFADATWAQIIEACQKKRVPDTWLVANQKTMTIGGTDYSIDIIGKNHDTYSDGSDTAPLTLQLHDCYTDTERMNGSETNSGWEECAMRNTYLQNILKMMPSEVQAGIRQVNKLTSAGNTNSAIETRADELFLLSEIEIFGAIGYSAPGEGTQYEYYKAGNSKSKNRNGGASDWWMRSPQISKSGRFCYLYESDSNGPSFGYAWETAQYGVSFAFCF